jgi:hypothetical protein
MLNVLIRLGKFCNNVLLNRVERVEVKDVRLPQQLQRAMAAEAEATREARAKVGLTCIVVDIQALLDFSNLCVTCR